MAIHFLLLLTDAQVPDHPAYTTAAPFTPSAEVPSGCLFDRDLFFSSSQRPG